MTAGEVRSYAEAVDDLIVGADTDHVRIVTADLAFLSATVESLHDHDADDRPGTVDLFSPSEVLTEFDRDFLLASAARDLTLDGDVSIRTGPDEEPVPTLVLSADAVVTVLALGGGEVTAAVVEDESARDRLRDRYDGMWERAMPHTVDAPPYSRLVARVEEEMGDEVRGDLERAFEATARRGPDDRLGPVALALIVAAAHRHQLRTVVDWATDVDLASQGTVSRTKTRLEDVGLLETEPVKNGVGRPRQRLVLAGEEFEAMSIDELVDAAMSVLG
jgi:hypothetical protein